MWHLFWNTSRAEVILLSSRKMTDSCLQSPWVLTKYCRVLKYSYRVYSGWVLCCRKVFQTGCQSVLRKWSPLLLHENPPGGTLSVRGCYKQWPNYYLHNPCGNMTHLNLACILPLARSENRVRIWQVTDYGVTLVRQQWVTVGSTKRTESTWTVNRKR